MSTVYVVQGDGETTSVPQVYCKNEEKELQELLEKNHDLLPGDQIEPDDPPRWLLIQREMPVPDPGTGGDRWSIDFLFADHHGTPTFVECKRYEDTRARREVVGQMLEYAANGQYYWDREILRDMAARSAGERGMDLETALQAINPDSGDSVDDYLQLMRNNLEEGQVRLIFFLEEAPHELRSIVEFLNKQMERSEVLIVEARQYEKDGMRLVVPSLFGYTEQARRIKKAVTVTSGERRTWTESEFFADASYRLDAAAVEAMRRLYDFAVSNEYQLKWGTGKTAGSFSILKLQLSPRALCSIYSNGFLALPFGGMNGDPKLEAFRDELAGQVRDKLGFALPEDYEGKYPQVRHAEWVPQVQEFIHVIDGLVKRFSNH